MSNKLTHYSDEDIKQLEKDDRIRRYIQNKERVSLQNFMKVTHIDPQQSDGLSKFVKKHPMHGTPYLPIGVVEMLLDQIFFGLWKVEKVRSERILNSIAVTLELHVLHPVKEIWLSRPGFGAVPIQQEKGSKAHEFEKIQVRALEKDFPHTGSEALKNAAKRFGKIFGRDLGRDAGETMGFTGMISDEKAETIENKSFADMVKEEQPEDGEA